MAEDFCLPSEDGDVCLKDYRGKYVVLYFYPKDNTSGCTREAMDFTNLKEEFERLSAVIIGISKDSLQSHKRFREKHSLGIILLSDTEKKVVQKYGVWKKKKLYGREYYGVERTTFLIDPDGRVVKIWPKVKVKDHVEEVLEFLKKIKGGE